MFEELGYNVFVELLNWEMVWITYDNCN